MSALPAGFAARAGPGERRSTACAHCSLPVPAGLLREGATDQFCCHACGTAWTAIRSCGLERYYEYLRDSGAGAAPARASGSRYEEFDDPTFAALYCAPAGPGLMRTTLLIEGLHCAACVWLLERAPRGAPGLVESRVDFGRGQITLVWRPERTALSAVARFVDSLGYRLHPVREGATREARLREDRAALIRIAIAGALFANTMLIAFALYGGMIDGMDPVFTRFFRGVSALLAGLAVCWPGSVFFRGALASLRVRTLHMDVPIAVALAVGLVHGIVNTALGTGEVYFDTLTTLVFLLLIGRFIQQRQQRRAADAVELLFSLTPSRAALVEGDRTRAVPAEALREGDVVEVAPNESVPADGEIVRGSSALHVALLTGEPAPAEVGPGDPVAAGAVNLTSTIRVRVRVAGRSTRIGQLMALVEEHARRRAPIVRLADRISVWFVAVVLAVAAGTLALWWPVSPAAAVEHTVALLIITCPCALGLATPLAVVVGIGRAARRGILIKGGPALEALAARGTVVFDKTGTLTTGDLRALAYTGPARLRPLVAAAEARCNHPVARALARDLADGAEPPDASVAHALGAGVEADVAGSRLVIGSPPFVLARCGVAAPPDDLARALRDAADAGRTPVLVAENGAPAAVVALGDDVREEAPALLRSLRAHGWRPVLLSGDDPRAARAVGERLGLTRDEIIGGASPERKVEFVRDAAAHGRVVMIGDGVNDAAALAAATVGVAVHGGAEAAMSAADAYLSTPGLRPVASLFHGARATTAAIRRNLAVSLAYNVLFGGLAVAGLINPLLAAVLMPLSGITVLALSFRTPAFREAPRKAAP